MADGLSTINTANLTAAMKSLLGKPLLESGTTPTSRATAGGKMLTKRKCTSRVKATTQSAQQPVNREIESAVIAIADQALMTTDLTSIDHRSQISPLTLKHLLSCISPVNIQDGHIEDLLANSHKLSIESVLQSASDGALQTGPHDSSSSIMTSNVPPEKYADEPETPGHVQISTALLLNLLNGISNPQFVEDARNSDEQNLPLPPFHHFAFQSLQPLLPGFYSHDDQTPVSNCNMSDTFANISVTTSERSCSVNSDQSVAKTASLDQLIAQNIQTNCFSTPHVQGNGLRIAQRTPQTQKSVTRGVHHDNVIYSSTPQQHQLGYCDLFQASANSQNNSLSPSPISIPLTNCLAGEPNLVYSIDEGNAEIQRFPLLLQPSGPGGPLQIVPLNKCVNTSLLHQIIRQSERPAIYSTAPSLAITVSSGTVNIQPKPSHMTIQNLIQAAQISPATLSNACVSQVSRANHEPPTLDIHPKYAAITSSQTAEEMHEADAHNCTDLHSETTNDHTNYHTNLLEAKMTDSQSISLISNIPADDTLKKASTMDTDELSNQRHATFCVDCNKLMMQPCKVHNTDYVDMPDTPVPSRALATLPSCFFLKQTITSDIKDLMGVWCKDCLSERTRFGPIVGQHLSVSKTEFQDQVYGFQPFVLTKQEKEVDILHLSDQNLCNWTMFIRLAPSLVEQNCTVYEDSRQFFIVTKTEIKDEELLMWFSSEICEQLGISQNPGSVNLLQCKDCGLYFRPKRLLHAHQRNKHPEKYNYIFTCMVCSKTFKSQGKLNVHMAQHYDVKPHCCSLCKKEFSDPSNLRTHMNIHTGDKKFKCDECGKTFRQKAHLDNHTIVHSGIKNFKCSYCEQRFGRSSDLNIHMYKHTKEVSFPCNVCGKMFYKSQNLNKHLKVHTGEKNYMCNKCFKGFSTKYHCDRHLKTCKEKNGKESSYMSLEEVARLDSTCDAVPLKKVSVDHEV